VIVDKLNAKEIKLHLPASCCLEKLLRHQGEIVSQEELILCGWGSKRNAGVSHNTYYQCILHLRKSLAALGFSDVIDTVPRHGLRFNNSVKVAYLYPDEDIELQIDNSVKTDLDGKKPWLRIISRVKFQPWQRLMILWRCLIARPRYYTIRR
jgi:DNA-binding winged helix-turn-helix (wHTH) protein